MFYYQDLLYFLKIIYFKLISRYHNNLSIDHFGIRENLRVNNSKILLANTVIEYQSLGQEL